MSRTKARALTIASDPRIVPTAMPAIVPLLKPLEPPDDAEDVATTVALATAVVSVESPESNSAAVTLKQGTWMLKSAASTNV